MDSTWKYIGGGIVLFFCGLAAYNVGKVLGRALILWAIAG